MPNTPDQAIPYPAGTDVANGDDQMLAAIQAMEKISVRRYASASARTANGGTMAANMVTGLTDTNKLYRYNGTSHVELPDLTVMQAADTAIDDRIQLIVLTADENRTSTTTLANSGLTLPVKANKQYKFEVYAPYQAASAGDLKYDLTFPAGATMRHTPWGPAVAQATNVIPPATDRVGTSAADGGGVTMGGNSNSGSLTVMLLKGSLRTAGTAGSLTLRFAQITSNASATTLKTGAYLEVIEN